MRLDAQTAGSSPPRLLRWPAASLLVTGIPLRAGGLGLQHWHDEEAPEIDAGSIAIELAPVAVAPSVDQTNLAHGPLLEEAAPAAHVAVTQPVENAEKQQDLPKADPSPLAQE